MTKNALGVALVLMLGTGSAVAAGKTFVVDAENSQVVIHVGKAGLLKFAGHEHQVLAPRLGGEIQADGGDLGGSSVSLTFDAAALQVSAQGEPPEDVPKVQARMIGAELLDVARFPSVAFRSTKVEGHEVTKGAYDLRITGELSIHGVTHPTVVQAKVEVTGDVLKATGTLVIRHTDFGLAPVSVAGVVKVKNEIAIDFKIQAAAKAAPGGSPASPQDEPGSAALVRDAPEWEVYG